MSSSVDFDISNACTDYLRYKDMINEECNGRILVVSNECFSETSSNGRTIMNFMRGVNPVHLAQFYLHGNPDMTFCRNYYRVSDRDALNAFLHKKSDKISNVPGKKEAVVHKASSEEKKVERNCRNLVLRNTVWMSFRWWDQAFEDFIDRFNPTVVLFQAGDMPFMFSIAMRISSERNIPLIMYNSEGYVLKKTMYAKASKTSVWHAILQKSLKHEYKKIMNIVSYCIYNTEYLEQCYQKKYPHDKKSTTLYTVSEMKELDEKCETNEFHLLYCGNLGVGRADTLDEIAKILKNVDDHAVLDIYGKFVSEEDKNKVCANSNVYYGGFVSYNEIPDLMSKATMLLHCENPDRINNLKHAFSTKIADSLASGRPFLVYASNDYPFVQYLKKNDCVHIASSPDELDSLLSLCISDEYFRKKYIANGLKVAAENHSLEKNCNKFRTVVSKVSQGKTSGIKS